MAFVEAPAQLTVRQPSPQELSPVDRVIDLADGRALGYVEYGDPAGMPVLFFHGFGTTRVVCPPGDTARSLGIRLIAFDRPGIGLSDPQPGRRLLDWPRDVAEAADRIGAPSFAVVGWSGGGPYALATAFALAERVSSVAIVSGAAPLADPAQPAYLRRFDRGAVRAAGRAPWVIRLALWHWGRHQRRDAEQFFDISVAAMCAADQEILAAPELRDRMIANSSELYRQGGRGMYDEALVLARPWGFDPAHIQVPVHLWHGALDTTVPIAMGAHLGRAIPGARLTTFPDEGHHLLYRHWNQILSSVVA